MLLVRNGNRRDTGGALAVSKGLVGQVERRVGIGTLFGEKTAPVCCACSKAIYALSLSNSSTSEFYRVNHVIDGLTLHAGKLYWTDALNGLIAELQIAATQRQHRVLVTGLDKPRAIVVADRCAGPAFSIESIPTATVYCSHTYLPYQLRARAYHMTLINKTKFLNDTDFSVRMLLLICHI